LLAEGAGIDKTDFAGKTALIHAIKNNHMPAARLLCEKGADTSSADATGRSAFHYALESDPAGYHFLLYGPVNTAALGLGAYCLLDP
jgi:ankyrin repeat protein